MPKHRFRIPLKPLVRQGFLTQSGPAMPPAVDAYDAKAAGKDGRDGVHVLHRLKPSVQQHERGAAAVAALLEVYIRTIDVQAFP